jgi:hypothetical protein
LPYFLYELLTRRNTSNEEQQKGQDHALSHRDKTPYCENWTDSMEKGSGPFTKCLLVESFRACHLFERPVTTGEMMAVLGAIAINAPFISKALYELAGKHAPMAAMALTFVTTSIIEQLLKDPNDTARERHEALMLATLGFCINNQDKLLSYGAKIIEFVQDAYKKLPNQQLRAVTNHS